MFFQCVARFTVFSFFIHFLYFIDENNFSKPKQENQMSLIYRTIHNNVWIKEKERKEKTWKINIKWLEKISINQMSNFKVEIVVVEHTESSLNGILFD